MVLMATQGEHGGEVSTPPVVGEAWVLVAERLQVAQQFFQVWIVIIQ